MDEKKKTDSRKFVVWLSCLAITVTIVAICVVAMALTKTVDESLVNLSGKSLDYFFIISMIYLGVNLGQKAAFAFADALTAKYESEKEADSE